MQSNPLWEGLRARLVHATHERGRKVALARELGVHRQTVSLWLSGGHTMPSAETTLRLLEFVEEVEAKQKESAGLEAPARKTRRKSNYEKDKPTDRKKH